MSGLSPAASGRPAPEEYGSHFGLYIQHVPEDDVLAVLEMQASHVERWPARVAPERETSGYAAGAWSPRQVMGHLTDFERVLAYRAHRFSRRDPAPLPGFDQDLFMRHAPYQDVPFQSLVAEFVDLRRANLPLFRRLDAEAWRAMGVASDTPLSVRALAYAMAGHVRHHAALLHERHGFVLEA